MKKLEGRISNEILHCSDLLQEVVLLWRRMDLPATSIGVSTFLLASAKIPISLVCLPPSMTCQLTILQLMLIFTATSLGNGIVLPQKNLPMMTKRGFTYLGHLWPVRSMQGSEEWLEDLKSGSLSPSKPRLAKWQIKFLTRLVCLHNCKISEEYPEILDRKLNVLCQFIWNILWIVDHWWADYTLFNSVLCGFFHGFC